MMLVAVVLVHTRVTDRMPSDWNISKGKNFAAQHRNLQTAASADEDEGRRCGKIGGITWNTATA